MLSCDGKRPRAVDILLHGIHDNLIHFLIAPAIRALD